MSIVRMKLKQSSQENKIRGSIVLCGRRSSSLAMTNHKFTPPY